MNILASLQPVLILTTLILIGVFLRKKGIVNENAANALSAITVKIALPANIFYTLIINYDKASLLEVIGSSNIVIISIGSTIIVAYLISMIFKIEKYRVGVFMLMSAFSNTVFIGVPVVSSILGEQALGYLAIYYIVNTVMFWTIGLFFVKKDAYLIAGVKRPQSKNIFLLALRVFGYILNPIVVFFILASFSIMLEIQIPSFIKETLKYLSSMAVPLSMIFTGSSLYIIFKDKILKTPPIKDIILIFIIKFLILPASVIFLLRFINMPPLHKIRKAMLYT